MRDLTETDRPEKHHQQIGNSWCYIKSDNESQGSCNIWEAGKESGWFYKEERYQRIGREWGNNAGIVKTKGEEVLKKR